MKLKSLELKNIRSYKYEKLEFNDGVTLFEGDIGSGKSTILLAIEFALFGLGNYTGSGLLRIENGVHVREGHVKLEFESNGKPYIVYRSLKMKW